eukprot:7225131-Pyramimonas_sp.AAC.1
MAACLAARISIFSSSSSSPCSMSSTSRSMTPFCCSSCSEERKSCSMRLFGSPSITHSGWPSPARVPCPSRSCPRTPSRPGPADGCARRRPCGTRCRPPHAPSPLPCILVMQVAEVAGAGAFGRVSSTVCPALSPLHWHPSPSAGAADPMSSSSSSSPASGAGCCCCCRCWSRRPAGAPAP